MPGFDADPRGCHAEVLGESASDRFIRAAITGWLANGYTEAGRINLNDLRLLR